MRQIILIVGILIGAVSESSAYNKISNEIDKEDFRYDLNITIDTITVDNIYFFSAYYEGLNRRMIRLVWRDSEYILTDKQYEDSLRKIFKIFKRKFPNQTLGAISSSISLVRSTYNALTNDAKIYLMHRKGLATMKDKKLKEVVEKSFLKTKQLEIACRLASEILHQKCQAKQTYLAPIAVASGFANKKFWVELSQEKRPLHRRNRVGIDFEE